MMDQKEFDAWEKRIAQRADSLWQDAGQPEGGAARYLDDAKTLISIEENPTAGTLDPEDAAKPVVEESALMRNLGEFPTLTDQGEETTYPSASDAGEGQAGSGGHSGSDRSGTGYVPSQTTEARNPSAYGSAAMNGSHNGEDETRQSDGDASETGGVLPDELMVEQDLPDISVADADITSDDTDADNEDPSENDDINEDGLPDQPVFDR